MVKLVQKGSFKRTQMRNKRLSQISNGDILAQYGQKGVIALMSATPKDTGKTAASWSYEIKRQKDSVSLIFKNSNINNGVPIALVIQYGHAMPNGYYVPGVDYINPALAPIFKEISEKLFEEIRNA